MMTKQGRVLTTGAMVTPEPARESMAIQGAEDHRPPAAGDRDEFIAQASPAPAAPPRPGVFTQQKAVPAVAVAPVPAPAPVSAPNPAVLSPQERLRAASRAADQEQQLRKGASEDVKLLASMRTLTALLCAVYARPGSAAGEQDRMDALVELSQRSQALGRVLAKVFDEDVDRSRYIQAMAMEAAVGLVSKQWIEGGTVRWERLIEASANRPEIMDAANAMATLYRPVTTAADVQDRVHVSLHAAFWQVYELGQSIDGISPALAASIVKDVADYLREHEKPVSHPDLKVAWVQGSVRRFTDMVCAEMRARFVGQPAPTEADIQEVLAVARTGFEGVESYAQNILASSQAPDSGPVDRG